MPGNLCLSCWFRVVMMLQSQLSLPVRPAGQQVPAQLSTAHPQHPTAHTPPFKPEQPLHATPGVLAWSQEQNGARTATQAPAHDQQLNHEEDPWHGRGLGSLNHAQPKHGLAGAWVLAGCLDAASVWQVESLAAWTSWAVPGGSRPENRGFFTSINVASASGKC